MVKQMVVHPFLVYYTRFTYAMGVYGCTRGFRAESHPVKKPGMPPPLMGHRVANGLANLCFYSFPFWNLCPLGSLINRMEIHYKGADRTLYPREYEEIAGHCMDTL